MRKHFFPGLVVLILLLFVELSFRTYFAYQYKIKSAALFPSKLLSYYYPNIFKVKQKRIDQNNHKFNVLLLGGSVLHPAWGDIEMHLKKSLQQKTSIPIEIDNMAASSHTSLDSRIKMELLQENHYDLIILYHGINELRFNLCPEEKFEQDYSHIFFYQKVKSLIHWSSFISIIPHTFYELKEISFKQLFPGKILTMGSPMIDSLNQDYIKWGVNVKTADPFYENYDAIIRAAIEAKTHLIIPSFAFHIPANYSLERFNNKTLDYNAHTLPIELWGSYETVSKGLLAHQARVELLEEKYNQSNILFIDMNNSLAKNPRYFNDVCHLSESGVKKFVQVLSNPLNKVLENYSASITDKYSY